MKSAQLRPEPHRPSILGVLRSHPTHLPVYQVALHPDTCAESWVSQELDPACSGWRVRGKDTDEVEEWGGRPVPRFCEPASPSGAVGARRGTHVCWLCVPWSLESPVLKETGSTVLITAFLGFE